VDASLSNRVFKNAKAINVACRGSWDKITPERLKTITAASRIEHGS